MVDSSMRYPHWRGRPISHLIDETPIHGSRSLLLDRDHVDFIETFTIYYGLDEREQFIEFLRTRGFLAKDFVFTSLTHEQYLRIVQTLKHVFIFDRMLAGLIGEDMINASGLPHLFESEHDLYISLSLFQAEYYKASLQILRSALEIAVKHSYLTVIDFPYENLESSADTRFSVTGKDGMLSYLADKQVVARSLSTEIADEYRALSQAVHSRFAMMHCRFEEHDDRDFKGNCLAHIKSVSILETKLMLCILLYQCSH